MPRATTLQTRARGRTPRTQGVRKDPFVLAISGFLQWFFLSVLVSMTAAAGVFGVYIVARLIKNPTR